MSHRGAEEVAEQEDGVKRGREINQSHHEDRGILGDTK